MTLSARLALWALRRAGHNLHRLEEGVYSSWGLGSVGAVLGPIILLDTQFVLTAEAEELRAVLLHERAHQILGHTRGWWLRRIWPKSGRRLHEEEFEADSYVRDRGLGQALIRVLRRRPEEPSHSHPSTEERVARIATGRVLGWRRPISQI